MKKLLKVTLLMIAVALFTFTGMSASEEVSSTKDVNENACVEVVEEGIGCKVYNENGTLIAKCFMCNCKKLAEGAQ